MYYTRIGKEGAKRGGGKVPEWQFGGDDVVAGDGSRPYVPAEGDVVLFDVIKVLSTKQERATNMRFVRAAPGRNIAKLNLIFL